MENRGRRRIDIYCGTRFGGKRCVVQDHPPPLAGESIDVGGNNRLSAPAVAIHVDKFMHNMNGGKRILNILRVTNFKAHFNAARENVQPVFMNRRTALQAATIGVNANDICVIIPYSHHRFYVR